MTDRTARGDVRDEDAVFLNAVAAESIGWQPLGDGAYVHLGDPHALHVDGAVIAVVGLPDASMAELNVVLLG